MRVRNLPAALVMFGFAALLSACSSSSTSPLSPTSPTGATSFDAQTFLQPFAARTDLLEFQNARLSSNPPGPNSNCPSTVPNPTSPGTYSVKWNYATQGIPPQNLDITGCDIGIYVGSSVKGVATIDGTHITGNSNNATGIWIAGSTPIPAGAGPNAQALISNVQVQGITLHSSVKCTAATCYVTNLQVQNGQGNAISAVGLRAEGGSNIYADQLQVNGYTDRGFLCVASQCGIANSRAGSPSPTNPNSAIQPMGYEFLFSVITNVNNDQSDGDGSAAKGLGFTSICSVDSNGNAVVSPFFTNANSGGTFYFSGTVAACNAADNAMPF